MLQLFIKEEGVLMNIEEYMTFVIITFLFVLSPGPAVLHAINNGVKYGNKASSWGVLGNVVALMLLILISSVGLGALLVASDIFFYSFKLIGAFYLFYLGLKLWLSVPNTTDNKTIKTNMKSSRSLFKEAFFVTASNPKALAYVTALLPQFLHTDREITQQIIILGLMIAVIQFGVLMSYVWFSNKTKPWLERERIRNIFNKISGVTFMGFGIALGVSGNKS